MKFRIEVPVRTIPDGADFWIDIGSVSLEFEADDPLNFAILLKKSLGATGVRVPENWTARNKR